MIEAATIEANVAEIRAKLGDWPLHMAARFNGAVYLVGSTLHHPNPRDCDFRIVVADHEFAARYGMELRQTDLADHHPLKKRRPELVSTRLVPFDEGVTQRWVDDVAKFGAHLSTRLQRNVDVKVWPDSYWRVPYPDPVLLAAPSSRWFIYNAFAPDPSAADAALPGGTP